jgi:hypothetical protein
MGLPELSSAQPRQLLLQPFSVETKNMLAIKRQKAAEVNKYCQKFF